MKNLQKSAKGNLKNISQPNNSKKNKPIHIEIKKNNKSTIIK